MAMPIYSDEPAVVEVRPNALLLTFTCAGETFSIAMTRYAAMESAKHIVQSFKEKPEEADILDVRRWKSEQ